MTGWAVPGLVHVRQVAVDAVGRRVVARYRMNRRAVSVTYLSPEFRTDIEFRERFVVESERLAQVRDGSVARVHQYVECGDEAAIVADHVEGTPLRGLLLEEGAVGTEAAVVVFKDALRGLAAGHAAGLAHGDLKPEYVVLTRAGRARLVDFGLSTHAGRRLLARSTPFYLAPEQWRGGLPSGPADLYAATAIFFECLVGAPPFYADSPAALAALHERGAPPVGAVPGPVRELVRAGLVKDPAGRPDARLLLTHVEEFAAHGLGSDWERRGRRELAGLLARPPHPADLPVVPVPRDPGRTRHVRLAAVLGGALVLAAGLSSPPLPSVLVPGPDGVASPDEATPPVMAFPGRPNGNAGSSTNGESATPDGTADPQSAAVAAPSRSGAGTELGAPAPSAGSAGPTTAPSGALVDQNLSRPAVPAPALPTPRTIPSQAEQPPESAAGSQGPVVPSEQQPQQPSEPSAHQQPRPRVVQAALSEGHPGPHRHRRAPEPRTYSGGDTRDGHVRDGDSRGGGGRDRDGRDGDVRDGGRADCGAADEHGDDGSR